MWPPDFIIQIRKQMQENPNKPILDSAWRPLYEETMQTCQAKMEEIKNHKNLVASLTLGRTWQDRTLELEFFSKSIEEHNQIIQMSDQGSPKTRDVPEITLPKPK
jgi:hypothetical protein